MPHYKILKPSYLIICGKCNHGWTRKNSPTNIKCPKCKTLDKIESKL